MYFAVPPLLLLLLESQLGCAAAGPTWVDNDRRQLAADDPASAIREEIARLEDALRVEYSLLASLDNNNAASTRSSSTNTQSSLLFSTARSRSHTTSISSSISLASFSSVVGITTSARAPRTSSVGSSVESSVETKATSTRVHSSTSEIHPPNSITPSTTSSRTSSIATFSSTASSTSSSLPMGSASSTPSAPASMASGGCENLCSSLTFPAGYNASPVSCVSYAANSTITITGGQADATCGSTITPEVDLCRVVLTVATSDESETYMEVWLPEGESQWNGRTMNTDNGGVNGCVHFVDMQYVSGLGFAAIGDNAGHNGSSFDGSWFADSNEVILDWAYRARHSSVVVGKAVVNQFYDTAPAYSYYIGCSAGGAQGLKSAQAYPNDFDGIISGSAAADFNHLQAWSGRFVQLTGGPTADTYLTEADWITVQSAIFAQCDAAIDGVADGILEDPTLCSFDSTVLACSNNSTLTGCLTDTQVTTVDKVFTELYNTEGELLFPALLYGAQVDAFRLGQLSGSVQAISEDWYKYAVLNDSNWVATDMDQSDYALADQLDAYHGNVSSYSGDLSAFQSSGGKMIMYHGMADPLVTEGDSQRYYLKVAKTMGIDNTGLDNFLRLFRISGMAHCGVGGISGAGAWMFGQNGVASAAPNNIITRLQDWVEDGVALDTLTGTKFWYDTPSLGVEFTRSHCRFPYRTTYRGNGLDSTLASSWTCEFIEDWQECGVGAKPRLCNVDGSFL